ncbi:hypothetical protein ACPPVO_24260 [Dactylosporangium sp. McL0621]|uniref:hypothetical protein n=1 Tax=Dactylosporangium sp. McL0621 TaxID=3415678 RepID=UPI003CFBADBB
MLLARSPIPFDDLDVRRVGHGDEPEARPSAGKFRELVSRALPPPPAGLVDRQDVSVIVEHEVDKLARREAGVTQVHRHELHQQKAAGPYPMVGPLLRSEPVRGGPDRQPVVRTGEPMTRLSLDSLTVHASAWFAVSRLDLIFERA